jgi:hypothetical protein
LLKKITQPIPLKDTVKSKERTPVEKNIAKKRPKSTIGKSGVKNKSISIPVPTTKLSGTKHAVSSELSSKKSSESSTKKVKSKAIGNTLKKALSIPDSIPNLIVNHIANKTLSTSKKSGIGKSIKKDINKSSTLTMGKNMPSSQASTKTNIKQIKTNAMENTSKSQNRPLTIPTSRVQPAAEKVVYRAIVFNTDRYKTYESNKQAKKNIV